ncbi:transketolase [Cyanobium sp. HWJ4-Hawea]|uniref:transketolase n=1 Tax=Cyanobium sp. HWJ4-Hawea TaxID=2823713 RepID=UPI0020CBAE6D|nr:transketolase [Cyanobium sp. HWJ4-Hawea]MCP9808658.1 transketolase [Cyanobium sp. HWJ4-Hawea]
MSQDSFLLAKYVRQHALRMVWKAGASHISSALSIADIVAVLFSSILNHCPSDPLQPDRDRVLLSKGHACTAIYAVLAELGYFAKEELDDYGTNGSRLMNHISHYVPGVEFSAGALGHLLPVGAGKALYAKSQKKTWNTYVILSDGELNEGSNWEAIMFAAHHRLYNLIAIVDKNNLQSFTSTQETLNMDPLEDKFSSFGWKVYSVDGHSHQELSSAFAAASSNCNSPNVIIANTTKGKGVSFMENKVEWHYKNPSQEQFQAALLEISSHA